MNKPFKLTAGQIQRLIPNIGGAIATDKITVEGNKVDYMVRETPSRQGDSGWNFYGGGETQDYLDDPANSSVYEVNTICNYDPDIIPFLTYPPGTEVERNKEGSLQVIREPDTEPSVRFMYPASQGEVTLPKNWRFSIAEQMFRRLDDSSLVLWRTGLTLWINVYNAKGEIESRIDAIRKSASSNATEMEIVERNGIKRLRYFLVEQGEGGPQSAAYMFGFSKMHEIYIAAYYDSSDLARDLDLIFDSLEYTGALQS